MESNSNTYLMMLYVTLQQESALRDYFVEQGWMFSKPDMSVTTDTLGPSVQFKLDPPEQEDADFLEDDYPALVTPSFPKIKITTRSTSKLNAKKQSESKKKKRKANSPTKKSTVSAKVSKVAQDITVPEFDESEENTDSENDEIFTKKKSHATQLALDGTELPLKMENEFGVDLVNEELVTGDFNEEFDGDEDDDFQDTEMDNDLDDDNEGSEESTNLMEETQTQMDAAIIDEIASNVNATLKKTKQKNTDPVVCTVCYKTFSCKSNLSKHMKRHGEKKFTCHVCSKGFYRLDEVKQHIMFIHEGRSPSLHICDVCGKMYKSKSGLHVHYAYKHSEDHLDDLKCKVCDKILSCKKKRLDHERKHVEGFKFTKCDMCGRMSKNIEEHKAYCSQTPVTERKKCGDCGAMFIDQKYLEKHMRTKHGFSYKCVACGLTFSDKKEIMDHTSKCFNIVIAEALGESFT